MRLICPNCATQYEVDDSAVPAAGREVQCGSCASTWFQAPARSNVSTNAEKGDLPKWVEDIVEDDAAEEAPDLPGEAPSIASAPNEDVVSEPELEGLIDTGDLEGSIEDTVEDKTAATSAELAEGDGTAAAASAKMASQAAVAATIANMTGAAPRSDDTPETDASPPDTAAIETIETDPLAEAKIAANEATTDAVESLDAAANNMADQAEIADVADAAAEVDGETGADDVSTQLETAIKERTSATKEDFPAIAAAELEASQAAATADAEASTAADAAIKAAERAAALEVAEKAAVLDQDAAPETPDAAPQTAETDDIEAQIKGALETLDAGKALPEDPSEERLSDYDFTDGDAADNEVPDEFAAILPDEASGPARGPTEAFDPADIAVDAPEQERAEMITAPSPVDPMVEAIERDAAEDQTESLAAKLKARVAEAAKAQESSAVGTAGVVLGASAAGIAATSTRRPTAFPKRDTEELASSLRPKSVEGNALKPRLRPAATPEPKQSRFGQGFIMALALFAVALLIYLFRDQLATAIPALEPALTSYAGVVDNVRLIFQDAIGKLTGSVSGESQS